jgi:hypothetical protein
LADKSFQRFQMTDLTLDFIGRHGNYAAERSIKFTRRSYLIVFTNQVGSLYIPILYRED